MNNITLTIVLCFTLLLIFIINKKSEKLEMAKMENDQKRYVDFVKSVTAKNIDEFNGERGVALPEQMQEDVIDVYDADPKRLLESLQKKDDDIENQN